MLALTLSKIGEGYLAINDLQRAKEYMLRASVLYNEQGHVRKEGNDLKEAIEYYEKGIDCTRKAYNGENSLELALLIENTANVIRSVGNF